MQSLLILGRQPELGLAELESLYGQDKLKPISNQAVIVDIDPCYLAFNRLGGSLKFAKLLTVIPSANWQDVENYLVKSAPKHVLNMPTGKMTFGLSLYGFNTDIKTISKSALKIKRAIQATGRSVRIVPNISQQLNAAQVIHNKLTDERSWELLLIHSKDQTYLAQTVKAQDIEGYAQRDQNRPYRDSKMGMLPPKLAQIIINLAAGPLDQETFSSICETPDNTITKLDKSVLDPFVGSGVILQEAMLMGYDLIGSDINLKMVEFTKKNLVWIAEKYKLKPDLTNVVMSDAQTNNWPHFDFVASETTLGQPLTKLPNEKQLNNDVNQLNRLISTFLANLAKQSQPGTRICLAVPAWQVSKNKFKHLPLIDQIANLGYNFLDFKYNESKRLIYYRPEQIVARELLTLIRN